MPGFAAGSKTVFRGGTRGLNTRGGYHRVMRRRTFVAGIGAGVAATAGCVGNGGSGDGVVTVATYD